MDGEACVVAGGCEHAGTNDVTGFVFSASYLGRGGGGSAARVDGETCMVASRQGQTMSRGSFLVPLIWGGVVGGTLANVRSRAAAMEERKDRVPKKRRL